MIRNEWIVSGFIDWVPLRHSGRDLFTFVDQKLISLARRAPVLQMSCNTKFTWHLRCSYTGESGWSGCWGPHSSQWSRITLSCLWWLEWKETLFTSLQQPTFLQFNDHVLRQVVGSFKGLGGHLPSTLWSGGHGRATKAQYYYVILSRLH